MKDDWFFKFDYKSGYHHVDIFPDHAQFLGCSRTFNGQCRYFKFMVLRFGLATAPFLFTKIQSALVKHWRRQGLRVFTYLDDVAGNESNYESAEEMSLQVQQDIHDSGFVVNDEKSQWDPVQCGELLGFLINLATGLFTVPERHELSLLCRLVISHDLLVPSHQWDLLWGLLNAYGHENSIDLFSSQQVGITDSSCLRMVRMRFIFSMRTLQTVASLSGLHVLQLML